MSERLHLYDTTLRDGAQTQGVQFTTAEKSRIAQVLDALGVDTIEGGWPGANPTDSEFFEKAPRTRATMAAFGMTKRSGRSANNDDVLAAVLNAGTPAVTLVGKSHEFHVRTALGIPLDVNLDNIRASFAHLKAKDREAIFDAEHFFDGYKSDPAYALTCLHAAFREGARWIVLCDTNGGTLPHEVARIVEKVIASGIPGDRLGIHTHDDTGHAAANSLAAVDAGARQIQGTLNGLGERCGNANLVTLIPTLLLKEPYCSRFQTGVSEDALRGLLKASRTLDDILNRVPAKQAPYVGASAFAHKAGLHASAIAKDPSTYEHVDPASVGNARIIPMSNQAGQSNLRSRLREAGIEVDVADPRLSRILEVVKEREARGYAYDTAQASFELLARRELGLLPRYFDVERYRVISERRRNARGQVVTVSEAVVTVQIGQRRITSFHENLHSPEDGDQGPVHALSRALAADLGPLQGHIEDMGLTDFAVRIVGSGTEAVTRVVIDFEDWQGRQWTTVGVSANIIDASFDAMVDGIAWKLVRDGAPVPA
jgi:2-isopropylmalate synthase